MPMEWDKEQIILKQQGGKQASQILLEGDIIVPDSKPDVREVLSCRGKIKMKDIRVGEERVNLSGELALCILYVSDQGEGAVYAMSTSLPLEDVIYMDGLEKDMKVKVQPILEHLECHIINDRKLGAKAVIGVTAVADRLHKVDVVATDQGENIAFLQGKILVEDVIGEKKDRFVVKQELSVPAGMASVGEILCSEMSLVDQEIRPMEGKVMIRSNLVADILYSDDGGSGTVHVLTEKIPFSGYLEVEGVTPKSMVDVGLTIGDVEVKTSLDDDGEPRLMDLEVAILGDLLAWDVVEKNVVTDAYAPGMETEVLREKIIYPLTIGRTKNQFSIKDKIVLDKNEHSMMQVEKTWGNVLIQDIDVEEDMVEVAGVLSAEILYFCEADDHAICMVKKGIPFQQKIELKGLKEGDEVGVNARLEEIDFQIISQREGEIFATIILEVEAKREETAELVTDVRLKELEKTAKHTAGAVIYKVQPGDSLWSIAKRYDTTIQRILMVNDIENPDNIYEGQKLLIVKMRP